MSDQIIDCAAFLRYTGARLGSYGIYLISEQCVRLGLTSISPGMSLATSDEQATLLEMIRDARLDFPTTPAKLAAWIENQAMGDFEVSAELAAAVAESDEDAAGAIKSKARTREDAMATEIRSIVKAVTSELTPGAVMAQLKARAGQKDSCVVESISKGVLWRRDTGDIGKLTLDLLQARLRRLRPR